MDYRFCPRCSHALTVGTPRGEEHPRLVCAECGYIVYRNSKPCAGAVVVREGKVLLARRALPPMQGVWDLPGGFLELGEHPEDGVVRELREETGLDIAPTELLGIYMDRYGDGDERTLNIYYLAQIGGGTLRPASDVSELAWFGPDELPEQMAFPHEWEVLHDWRKRAAGRSVPQ